MTNHINQFEEDSDMDESNPEIDLNNEDENQEGDHTDTSTTIVKAWRKTVPSISHFFNGFVICL